MSMNQIKIPQPSTGPVFQDDCRESGGILFHNVVISVEHKEPTLSVELFQLLEYIAVIFLNLLHSFVFPEFVAISQFNIGEVIAVVVFQRSLIEGLIFQKIIVGVADTPVAVAKKYIFALIGKRESAGSPEGFPKAGAVAHGGHTSG